MTIPPAVTLAKWRAGQELTRAELAELEAFYTEIAAACEALGERFGIVVMALRMGLRRMQRLRDYGYPYP